jgi:hypothetical protein
MEQFNQKSKAAVQEANRLALKNKELEDVERLLGK